MLFGKYQYRESDIKKRGYSHTAPAESDDEQKYWVKWILGIEKDDKKAKMLSDRLRRLQKARHDAIPEIIQYGYDQEQTAYAVVYRFLDEVETFEEKISELSPKDLLSGLGDLAKCLNDLHSVSKTAHGDIQPGNILIDKNGKFYLIDFGLADITRTLSQTRELEIFAKDFAAPEKFDKLGSGGFPYQSDIYSFGRIIEWCYTERNENIDEDQNIKLQRILSETPADRPRWQEVIEFLVELESNSDEECIWVSSQCREDGQELIERLNTETPIFDISPSPGKNYLTDVVVGDRLYKRVLWLKDECKLLFNGVESDVKTKDVDRTRNWGKRLPGSYRFASNRPGNVANLTPFFHKWFVHKNTENSLRKKSKLIREQLEFYRELLEKEKKVVEANSLRLQYHRVKVNGSEISFYLKPNNNMSKIGFINEHIDQGNNFNSDGFEYEVSANSDRRSNKGAVGFTGVPYDYDTEKNIIKIKDCEHLQEDKIPSTGYLFENIRRKEAEKNRQLNAIQKVGRNEVQNPDLIHYLFSPDKLPSVGWLDDEESLDVKQMGEDGKALQYSYNQEKAIRQALIREPLSVIQGPPGTGKTTVITEIVFQILTQHPEAKILITSQTNNAVDQVLENLLKNDIPVVRLSGVTKPKIEAVSENTIDRKLEGWKKSVTQAAKEKFKYRRKQFEEDLQTQNPFAVPILRIILQNGAWKKRRSDIEKRVQNFTHLEKLTQLPDNETEAIEIIDDVLKLGLVKFLELQKLHRAWLATVNSLDEKSAISQRLIDSVRVIGATCNHIAAQKYNKYDFDFDYVIMDEASKATIAEALVPIITGKNLILVGDHRQLRPMLTTTREVENWLRKKYKKEAADLESWEDYFNRPSLFECVIEHIDDDYKAQLTECRRLTESQVERTSKYFYESNGDEPLEYVKRPSTSDHNLPLKIDSSIFFLDIGSEHKHKKENTSSYNEVSVKVIPEVLKTLNKYDIVQKYSLGVITGYTAQLRKLRAEINKSCPRAQMKNIYSWNMPGDKFTISVVDRFQGLERDVVILDLVKSGFDLDLGFLEVPNRINVALSRQKRLLMIVGDYKGIINAKTRRLDKNKAALQYYLESLKKDWVLPASRFGELFI